MQLFRVVIERKQEQGWKLVRAYVVMAENEEEARKRIYPLFFGENVFSVERQDKSPYAYLLPDYST